MTKKAELEGMGEPQAKEEPKEVTVSAADLQLLKDQIANLEAKLIDRDTEINKMKEKEEGWLVVCNNPLYNGTTYGVLFTDGMAFIPKDKVFPRFVDKMPPLATQRQMETDLKRYPDGKAELEIIKQSVARSSAEKLVNIMRNDLGYSVEYFTKDEMDILQNKINARAKERAEAQAKLDREPNLLDKLTTPTRM